MRHLSAWVLAGTVLAGAALGEDQAPWPAPTEAEIRATIEREMGAVYLSESSRRLYGYTGVSIEMTAPEIGPLAQKHLSYDKAEEPAWPVKTVVTATAHRADAAPQVDIRGEGEIWYFYQTAEGSWTYKLGS